MQIRNILLLAIVLIFNTISSQEIIKYEDITEENAANLQLISAVRGSINDLAWSPDGTTLAVVSRSGLWLYNPDDIRQPPERLYSGSLSTLAYSNDGKYLSAGMFAFTMPQGGQFGADRLLVWDTQEDTLVFEEPISIVNMLFFPDSSRLLTLNSRGGLEIWDIRTQERLVYSAFVVNAGTSVGYGDIVLSISPDGNYFSASSFYFDEDPPIWSTQQVIEQQQINRENAVSDTVITNEWLSTPIPLEPILSPSGELQVSTDDDRERIIITDANATNEISSLYAHLDIFLSVYSHSDDQRVRVWNPIDFDIKDIALPGYTVSSRQIYSPDGQLLAAKPFESQNQIDIWDMSSRSLHTTYQVSGEPGTVSTLEFTSDNHYLLVTTKENNTNSGVLTVIDLLSDEIITELTMENTILDIAVSPDNLSFALVIHDQDSMNSQVQLWAISGINSEQNPFIILDLDFLINKLLYATTNSLILERELPDGTTTLSLLDIEIGTEYFFEGTDEDSLNSTNLHSPSLSIDRKLLAAATSNGIRFWEVNDLTQIATIDTDSVVYVSFHRDGKTLISVHGEDIYGDLRLWSVPSEEP